MEVVLTKEWIGKPAGSVIELPDAKAKRLLATGLVVKLVKPKQPRAAKKKAAVPKGE